MAPSAPDGVGGHGRREAPLWLTGATFAVAAHQLEAVERFYREGLGLRVERDPDELRLFIGAAQLRFAATSDGEPFYHFAFLVPGNRFDAGRAWIAARTPLLSEAGSQRTTFDFEFWDAQACYVHDPAGNIVELIAHGGLADSPKDGDFDGDELVALSEVGLVTGDLLAALERLRGAGLALWFGEVHGPREGLGFVGRKAHTLILCPTGRPWLPTDRPAEPHPVEVVIGAAGRPDLVVRLQDGTVDAGAPS